MKRWMCIVWTAILVLGVYAQNVEVSDSLRMQRKLFPQEKVYVVTDREMYATGDTLWFRGWVVDGETLKEKQTSRYLYVELRDPAGFLKKRVRVMVNDEGVYEGYLPLDINLPSNCYTLVAYTYYMIGTNDSYFFKRQVDVLIPDDILLGATTTRLKERGYPEVCEEMDADSEGTITVEVPANGSYAVSMTHFSMNTVDTTAIITRQLPSQKDLFTEASVRRNGAYLIPTYPMEQGNMLTGTVYGNFNESRPQKDTDVTAVFALGGMRMATARTDDKGHFEVPLPEFPDSTTFMVQAKKKKSVKLNIEFDKSMMPGRIEALPVRFDHFTKVNALSPDDNDTKKWALQMKNDQSILLDEVVVNEKKIDVHDYQFQKQSTKLLVLSNEETMRIASYRELCAKVAVYSISGALMYHSVHPVDVYFDGFPMEPKADDTQKSISMNNDEGVSIFTRMEMYYPPYMIKAVEVLNNGEAMCMPMRGFTSDSYVVNFITKKGDDLNIGADRYRNFAITMPLGTQKPCRFQNVQKSREYAPPVVYWHPAQKADADGKLHISLRMPDHEAATYRIIVEGIAPDGELVHRERFVRLR